MKILLRLIPYAKPLHHFIPEYVIYTFLGIIFGLANFALLIPILDLLFNKGEMKEIISHPSFEFSVTYFKDIFYYTFQQIIVHNGKFGALLFVCCIVGVSVILTNFFRYMAVRVLMRLRLRVMYRLRNDLFEKYLKQSIAFHHDHQKGEPIMILTSEVGEIESSVINALQVLFKDPFIVIAYFCMLLYWSAQLTLFTLIFLPISGILISSITRRLKKLNYFSQDTFSSLLSFTGECLYGIRQVQSFTAEKLMLNRFMNINDTFSKNSKVLFGKKELAAPISEVLGIITALTLILFGGYLIINGKTDLTGNGFIAYLALYTQMIQPLKNISQTSASLQRGIAAAERIFKIKDAEITIVDHTLAVEKMEFKNEVALNNISFSYNSNEVIKNISLKIPEGKKVALVGSSGSGKSTLVDLICRYYDVKGGSITIDGVDVKEIKLSSLRKMIGFVSQNTFLFNDTIANNIALGKPGATEEEIIEAAKIANAHDFILHSENGYQTNIGESGMKLSGGQRQRIAIARAVLKNAPILVLDEATSSLDTESERLVQDAINNMMENRTSIVIAHRLSTVRNATEIVVIDKGEIAEQGTHEFLMQKQGIYKRLVDLQIVK